MKKLIIACFTVLSANSAQAQETGMKLWYDRPATQWVESLPLGNGRLGAMVYGDPIHEEFQLNEETIWGGSPYNNTNPKAKEALPQIRQLIFEGRNKEAQALCGPNICSQTANGMPYQTVGSLHLDFEGTSSYSNYYRELDIEKAVTTTRFTARRSDLYPGSIYLFPRSVTDHPADGLGKREALFHSPLQYALPREYH